MAIIGELGVNIVANVKGFTKGIGKVQTGLKGIQTGFKNATKQLQGFSGAFLGIGGGLSLAGFSASLAQSAQRIDELAKTSQKLGIATENLAGLQVAADRTGVNINSLNAGIQRMTRRVAEAAQGSGEAVKALAELGLNASELNMMAPDKQFRAIAEAMRQIDSEADKVRLSFKLFDSEGVALKNTLALGADGLDRFADEAKQLGLAVSAEEAAKVERFNDAVSSLRQSFQGFANRILIDLAPGMAETLEGLTLGFNAFQERRAGQAGQLFRTRGASDIRQSRLARLSPAFRGIEFLQRQSEEFGRRFFFQGVREGQSIRESDRLNRAQLEELRRQTEFLRFQSALQQASTAEPDIIASIP